MSENHVKLKDLFYSTFHDKYDFEEMISMSAENESSIGAFNRKGNKEDKSFYRPNQKLIDMHTFIRLAILQYLKIAEDVVYSFRSKKNVTNALVKHKNNKFFFLTDFNNFFQNIIKKDVENIFLCNLEIINPTDLNEYISHLLNLVLVDDKLPIGFSTSPIISNSVLYEFDLRINSFCIKNSISYSRYADDLIFSSNDNHDFTHVINEIKSVSSELFSNRLSLNQRKNKFLNRASKIKIMGSVILPNGNITVDKKIKNDLESAIYIYMNKPEEWKNFLNKKFPSGIEQVSGLIGYVNSIDTAYVQKLRKKYGVLAVDVFLKKSF